jgi:hypothetical protein
MVPTFIETTRPPTVAQENTTAPSARPTKKPTPYPTIAYYDDDGLTVAVAETTGTAAGAAVAAALATSVGASVAGATGGGAGAGVGGGRAPRRRRGGPRQRRRGRRSFILDILRSVRRPHWRNVEHANLVYGLFKFPFLGNAPILCPRAVHSHRRRRRRRCGRQRKPIDKCIQNRKAASIDKQCHQCHGHQCHGRRRFCLVCRNS